MEVNDHPVKDSLERLRVILTDPTKAAIQRAREIAAENARMNLGDERNINVPTLPFELLHPRNAARFKFTIAGIKELQVRCIGLRFEEQKTPTLIRTRRGHNVRARGIAWVDARTGEPWRAEITLTPEPIAPTEKFDSSVVIVDFEQDSTVGLMVPPANDRTILGRKKRRRRPAGALLR